LATIANAIPVFPVVASISVSPGFIFLPFSLFFDRIALVDSLLSAFGVWALNLAILLGRTLRLDVAMILGMTLGGALLTKSPGMFFVGLTPVVSFWELRIKNEKLRIELKIKNYLNLLFLLAVSLIFTFGIYNILRLGPNFHMIGIRNKDYVYSINEVIRHPFDPFLENIKSIWRYYWHYLTPPIFILGLIGILMIGWKLEIRNWSLLFWWGIPLLVQAAIAKVFTARYILFSLPIFVLFVVMAVEKLYIWKIRSVWRLLSVSCLMVGVLFSLVFDWHLWHNPVRANFPQDERKGYLEDWTAGWGIREIADYLKQLTKAGNVIVGTEGFFGTLPEGLQLYLEKEPKITVIGVGYPIKTIPESLINAKRAGDKVYLVVNQSRLELEGEGNQLKLIREYPKPGGDKLLFFEVK